MEAGKSLAESRGELRRPIENVEVACGAPMLMQGYNSEDIAAGIDEMMIRQPLGVTAIISPFNFPGMIPFWFLPYSIAAGNTVVIKPSERVPMTMQKVFRLLDGLKLPAGVVNLVNGSRDVVNAILDHPIIRSVSFVGSSTTARHVYARGAAAGKRVQCQGGAKNRCVMATPDMSQRRKSSPHRVRLRRPALPSVVFRDHLGRRLGPIWRGIRAEGRVRVTGYGLGTGAMGRLSGESDRASSRRRSGHPRGARTWWKAASGIPHYEAGNFGGSGARRAAFEARGSGGDLRRCCRSTMSRHRRGDPI